jgi:hypothetical protein
MIGQREDLAGLDSAFQFNFNIGHRDGLEVGGVRMAGEVHQVGIRWWSPRFMSVRQRVVFQLRSLRAGSRLSRSGQERPFPSVHGGRDEG